MAEHSSHQSHLPPHAQGANVVIQWLERMDNWAHVIVAAFFILMASTVMIHVGFIFMQQIPLINHIGPMTQTMTVAPDKSDAATVSASPATGEKASAGEEAPAQSIADPFVKNSLELLSNILFVVILLELLRTIITYLETHDIQAIMQEFLVVGIISSVRKILLVGAEASLRQGATQTEFIQEASGVVIDILGILLLIAGLIMLKRAFGSKAQKELQEV